MGMFIVLAILTDLDTMIETSSCGEVTIIIPSTAMDWKTVSGTSPVPGGISINMKSTSIHITSVQNCLTVPAIIGPLQITGSVSFSKSRLIDGLQATHFPPFSLSWHNAFPSICGKSNRSVPLPLCCLL